MLIIYYICQKYITRGEKVKFKGIMLIALMLILVTMLGAVSAFEDNATNDLTFGDESSNVSEEILQEDYKTFNDLNILIENSADNSEIKLENDYIHDSDVDKDLNEGIEISKSLTIDGQDHTINGKNSARIFRVTTGNLVLKNIHLINGNATDSGGAILTQSPILVVNSTFDNNMAQRGGGIYTQSCTVTVIDCAFTNNELRDFSGDEITEGAGIYAFDGEVSVTNSRFINNTAYYGGAIHTDTGKIGLHDTLFKNNTSPWYAGGAVHTSGEVTITNSIFIANHAPNYGGAVFTYNSENSRIFVKNSTFTNNTSDHYGGAISGSIGIDISDSTFTDNTATDEGGAISIWGDVLIKNSNFTGNNANGSGGVIYTYDTNIDIISSNFINNHAERHGGVIDSTGNITITDSTFTGNSAGWSGGILCSNSGEVNVLNSNFNKNSAGIAGGAIVYTGQVNVENSNFTSNNAQKGGAIRVYGSILAVNSTFENNAAVENGGAILNYDLTLINSTFKNNRAGYDNTVSGYANISDSKIIEDNVDVTENAIKTYVNPVNNLEGHYVNVDEAYDLLNAFRAEPGVWYWNYDDTTKTYLNTNSTNSLKPLQKDTALEEAAEIRAKELVVLFEHTRPDESSCFTVYPDDLMNYGENIAMGQPTCKYVTEDWKETEYQYAGQGHRRNMLDSDFNCVGIAGFEYEGYIYWVQAFGFKDNIFYNESRTSYEPAVENNNPGEKTNSSAINITYDDDKYDVDIHFDDPTQTDPENTDNNKSDDTNQTNTNNNTQENTNENNPTNTNNNTQEDTNAPTMTDAKPKTKKATKITAKKATFKAKAKTKKYTITLKTGKKAINKVKVYLKIKGKTFTAKTNKNGKATFKIKKLSKKGIYKATIQFKGNNSYNPTTKKITIKIK